MRFRLLIRIHSTTALRHSSGISETTPMRARASSPRLVSWVVVARSSNGQSINRLLLDA